VFWESWELFDYTTGVAAPLERLAPPEPALPRGWSLVKASAQPAERALSLAGKRAPVPAEPCAAAVAEYRTPAGRVWLGLVRPESSATIGPWLAATQGKAPGEKASREKTPPVMTQRWGSLFVVLSGPGPEARQLLDLLRRGPEPALPPTVMVPDMVALLLEASPPVSSPRRWAMVEPATASPSEEGDSYLRRVVLCSALDSRNRPVDQRDSFPEGTRKVELYLECSGPSHLLEIRVDWYQEDRPLARQILEVRGQQKYVSRIYSDRQAGLRNGSYEVRISAQGEELQTLTFSIGEESD
jgi:hypothetical protein